LPVLLRLGLIPVESKMHARRISRLAAVLVAACVGAGAHAQGVVTFANHVLLVGYPPPARYVYDVDGVTRLTGTQYAAQLYYSTTDATSLTAHTTAPNRFRAAGDPLAGTWSTPTGANRTLTGGGAGVPVFAQVRVWDLNQFATYEAAVAGGGISGTSAIFLYVERWSGGTPSVSDTYMDNFSPFTLVIPEPSVCLLTVPGVVMLLLLVGRHRPAPQVP
jgi:hypothetical protein